MDPLHTDLRIRRGSPTRGIINDFESLIVNRLYYWNSRMTCHYHVDGTNNQGAVSIRNTALPGMAIPMLKIRRPNGRLIFNMELAIRR